MLFSMVVAFGVNVHDILQILSSNWWAYSVTKKSFTIFSLNVIISFKFGVFAYVLSIKASFQNWGKSYKTPILS